MPEEIIGGNGKVNIGGSDNHKEEIKKEALPPTDFKIAEIWIRNGQIMLDASESFWADKVRALGVFELCKDIVKNAQFPKQEKPKIITGTGVVDFVRNGFRKKRK